MDLDAVRSPQPNAHAVTPAQLAGHRIWMPGLAPGTEWAAYYEEFATAFGLTIDVVGPVFGNEALLAEIADSSQLATLVGAVSARTRRDLDTYTSSSGMGGARP